MMFFKKKSKELGWNTLPVKYLKQINNISNNKTLSEDDKILYIASLLFKVSYEDLISKPLTETKEIISKLKFLYTKPEGKKSINKLNLNGTEYTVFKDVKNITTAQFIDFNNIITDYENNIGELLSLFIIPKGHKYNDGYDLKKVINDINEYLSIEDALGLANFFIAKYEKYTIISLAYLEGKLRWLIATEKNPKVREMMKEELKTMKSLKKHIRYLIGFH